MFQARRIKWLLVLFPLVSLSIPRLHKTEQNLGLLLGVPLAWSALENLAGESSIDLGCSA